ncbi:MAG: DUF177 domain-containing protein [Novosphingobium sp.]|nr:DUF177 domain-containing protein [Novosphingobium sp.]
MTAPEFSRLFDVRQVDGRQAVLSATGAERAALAQRFGLVRVDRLDADMLLARDGESVCAEGSLRADIVQSCAVSAEDLPVSIDERVFFRFVPETARLHRADEEVELDAGDLDEIPFQGTSFDLGEAVAQSLALAIDPFATGPGAEEARALLKDGDASPFAMLKGLKSKG